MKVGDDGRRSTNTDIGIILSEPMDGRVQVQFQAKRAIGGVSWDVGDGGEWPFDIFVSINSPWYSLWKIPIRYTIWFVKSNHINFNQLISTIVGLRVSQHFVEVGLEQSSSRQDTIQQTVPLGWIVRLREWEVGDRVQAGEGLVKGVWQCNGVWVKYRFRFS